MKKADHLHRPEFMTDTSGNVVWQASYEPFGTVSTITGSVTENRRFPGQYFQLEAGLAYNWYRHYDSTIGRYTTPDPLGLSVPPSASAPLTISGTPVEVDSGFSLLGIANLPASAAIDPQTYPLGLSSLAILQQAPLGFESKTPPANAVSVSRDGPTLFGYAKLNPLVDKDPQGLFSVSTPLDGPSPDINSV